MDHDTKAIVLTSRVMFQAREIELADPFALKRRLQFELGRVRDWVQFEVQNPNVSQGTNRVEWTPEQLANTGAPALLKDFQFEVRRARTTIVRINKRVRVRVRA